MVCDFFYPNCGGIETHIYQLSQCLIGLGHKVVIFTHAYGNRYGVRWLTSGLKVYHVPRRTVYDQATAPSPWGCFALLRCILIRERITVVHAHQAFSAMAQQALLHSRTLGYKTVFTDHSLVGFADMTSIAMNKALKWTLTDVHAVICVSHTSKENTVLRVSLPPDLVYVIPNAVDATQFEPAKRQPLSINSGRITVVTLSRLVYRKGIDLLAAIIPAVCRRHPNVDFLIGGDGPKAALLRETVEREGLESRVTLLGAVPSEGVRDVLVQGDIFLNASLTEAFCIALVEGAAAGLLCVSTAVGGVPEVLPSSMLLLSEPCPEALVVTLDRAIQLAPFVDRHLQHRQVAQMYNWHTVAARTVRVYDAVACSTRDDSLVTRLIRVHKCGPLFGKLACLILIADVLMAAFLQWIAPVSSIEAAAEYQEATLPTANAHKRKKPNV